MLIAAVGDEWVSQLSNMPSISILESINKCSICSALVTMLRMLIWPSKSPFGLDLESQINLALLRVWKKRILCCFFITGFRDFSLTVGMELLFPVNVCGDATKPHLPPKVVAGSIRDATDVVGSPHCSPAPEPPDKTKESSPWRRHFEWGLDGNSADGNSADGTWVTNASESCAAPRNSICPCNCSCIAVIEPQAPWWNWAEPQMFLVSRVCVIQAYSVAPRPGNTPVEAVVVTKQWCHFDVTLLLY